MAQDMGLITDTWMTNPYMFDPTQLSNAYSNYNNAALPWPPSYNTGAGGPVNAATGQPIQSFQNWQQANPGGMNINSTPAQPAVQPQPAAPQPTMSAQQASAQGLNDPSTWQRGGLNTAQWNALSGPQKASYYGPQGIVGYSNQVDQGHGSGADYQPIYGPMQPPQQQQQAPQAAPQASAPPNNWQAAINALANPGRVQTMGANVPLVQGYQPSGGVNQAFLQNAGQGQGMNQGFLSALRAIQNR
jgi:hypothetical protein